MTTWLIGSCPSDGGSAALVANGCGVGSADRLREMLDITVEQYDLAFSRTNVLEHGPWRPRAARHAGAKLKKVVGAARAIVLGRDAWLALGLPTRAMFFETYSNFTLVPHPSGRNRLYNHEEMRVRLREVVENALADRR
jgi:hypothetical protein